MTKAEAREVLIRYNAWRRYDGPLEQTPLQPGERIAQLVICPVIQAEWQQVESLDKTDRGENGFGSTGK